MSTRGDRIITLPAVGDLDPARKLVPAAPATQHVWEHLRTADLATANLEIPLTNELIPVDKAITVRAAPGLALSLKEAGLNAVTVANNHALDQGSGGLLDTLSALDEADVAAVGGGVTLEEVARPAMISYRVSAFPSDAHERPGRARVRLRRGCGTCFDEARKPFQAPRYAGGEQRRRGGPVEEAW